MKRKFMYCCVCGKSADVGVMFDAEPLRGVAKQLGLSLAAPEQIHLHFKCKKKLSALIALRDADIRATRQKQLRDDQFHREV